MIGKVLKYMRRTNKLKQDYIGKKIKVARNTISQYETGTIQPTFETIEKIAKLCGYKIYFENIKSNERFESKDLDRKEI